ncbi:MAG: type II toxin-antitoxin system YhaV family toxin [Pseudomonadota bacterium]
MSDDVNTTFQNGWALYAHPFFLERLTELVATVKRLRARDPGGFYKHPATKLLQDVQKIINNHVPTDPAAREFLLGNTLGKQYRSWRRVKRHLPPRYRLFFKFQSDAPKSIVYVWLNDEGTLRQAGSKTDVYEVFKKMLKKGSIPDSYQHLVAAAESLSSRG